MANAFIRYSPYSMLDYEKKVFQGHHKHVY